MSGIIGVSPDMRSGVVGKYPKGHVINSGQVFHTGGYHTISSTTEEAAFDYAEISCVVGNTIHFGVCGSGQIYRDDNTTYRNATVFLKASTSDVSAGATSSLGDSHGQFRIGRQLVSASTVDAASLVAFNVSSSFVATAATHYLGLSFTCASAAVVFYIYAEAASPLELYHFEIQGNVKS